MPPTSPLPRYRLLACDVDDTLVRFPDPPSPRVVAAVRAAVGAGVTVALVTGRAYRRARPVAEALGLDAPIICNHGGSIRGAADGAMIHRETLPRSLTLEIVGWLQTQEVCQFVFDGDTVYHDCRAEQVVPDFRVYAQGEDSVYAPDLRTCIPEHTEVVLSSSPDHEHLVRVHERAVAHWGEATRVLFSHPYGIDIMPHSSKSRALAWLAAELGVAREQVAAIGDGGNDVDMLSWAGLGVAMGDGVAEAKRAASVVAPSFDEDGAAWAIERYVLG